VRRQRDGLTLVPVSETVRTIEAADGYRLAVRSWEAEQPSATLVLFSGVVSHSAWFRPVGGLLAARGFTVIGADRRGSGLCDAARGDAPSAGVLLDDAAAVAAATRVPGKPLVLVGWCWGAILATGLAARLRGEVAGLALLTPGLWPTAVIREGMAARAKLAALADPQAAAVSSLDSPITDDMFTTGPALGGFIAEDPLRLRLFSPRFLDVSTRLTVAAAGRLRTIAAPILCVLASRDRATDNEATLAALSTLSAPVTTVTLVGDHGLQFDAPAELAAAVGDWVKDVVLAS
jgi:alpha-beta hydrolase superfamily lysophospholipase